MCPKFRSPSHVTYDYGIAVVSEDLDALDVGVLHNILLVSYGELHFVVMEGAWIKRRKQGIRVVKKDRLGTWTVLSMATEGPMRIHMYSQAGFPKFFL